MGWDRKKYFHPTALNIKGAPILKDFQQHPGIAVVET